MPLLLILLTIAACLPTSRFARPAELSRLDSLLLTILTMAVPALLTARAARAAVAAGPGDPEARTAAARRYSRFRRRAPLLTLAAAVLCVVGWGWSSTVAEACAVPYRGEAVLFPFAEALVPLPYFLALLCNWVSHYGAERALHLTSGAVRRGEAAAEFWTLGGYLGFQARQLLLMLGLPVGVCLVNQALERFAPDLMRLPAVRLLGVAGALALFVGFPRLVPSLLGLTPIPPGPARDRLAGASARLGVTFTEFLLWPTRGLIVNALVLGVVPRARYVIFTDRILDSLTPPELDAVFGHEAGHVRHGHLWFYLVFLILSALFLGAAATGVEQVCAARGWAVPTEYAAWLGVVPLVALGGWFFVVFGWLSRRCERQADVSGARAGSCGRPDCPGHDPLTPPDGGGRVCRTGALAMVAALDRVGETAGLDRPGRRAPLRERLMAWVRAWQHGPMSHRVEFLMRLADDPTLADAADRSTLRARALLVAALVAGIAVLSLLVSWADLARSL